MQKQKRLEDVSFGASASRQIRLQTLPPGKRVRRISLFFDLSGTKDAADALDGALFPQIVNLVKLSSSEGLIHLLTGMETAFKMHAEQGRRVMDPTDIPGTGTTFAMQFQLDLLFRGEKQLGVDDGALPTELFTEHTLEITFAAANVWGVGNLTVTAGSVRAQVELVDGSGIPQITKCKWLDLASGMAVLDSGVIKQAFLVQTDYSSITQAEITEAGLMADDVECVPTNTRHEQLIAMWNQDACQQMGGVHELVVNAALFLPLIWEPKGKAALTKQPLIEKKGEVRITSGTLTTPRLVIVYVEPKSADMTARLAQKIGAPASADTYEPAVASKSEVRAEHRSSREGGIPTKKARAIYSHLAGKMRSTPTKTTPT